MLIHLRGKETESNGGVKAGEGDEITNLRFGFLIDEEEDRWRRLAAYAFKGWSLCREKEETMTQGLRREETTCLVCRRWETKQPWQGARREAELMGES